MTTPRLVGAVTVALMLGLASAAQAQTNETKWSIDVGIGWDNSIAGNINSSTIGSINNQTVVILTNQYEEVYGTGLHFRVGGGYMLNPTTEARVTLAFQALDSDLATLGDYGASPLYGDYTDYESTSLDFGLRRYGKKSDSSLRPYVEGSIGIGVHQRDRPRTGGAAGQPDLDGEQFLPADHLVYLGGQCRDALGHYESDGRLRAAWASLRERSGGRGQHRGHGSRLDQRQQLALDAAVCHWGAGGILTIEFKTSD